MGFKMLLPDYTEDRILEVVQGVFHEEELDAPTSEFGFEAYLRMHTNNTSNGEEHAIMEFAGTLEDIVSKAPGQRIFYVMLLASYLVLVGVSSHIIHFFKCDQFSEAEDGKTKEFLFKDYSIDCLDRRYKAFTIYTGFMVAIYPCGIPLAYLALVYKHRCLQPSRRRAVPILHTTRICTMFSSGAATSSVLGSRQLATRAATAIARGLHCG